MVENLPPEGLTADLVDQILFEGLPDDRIERLLLLRAMVTVETYIPAWCPECGRTLAGLDVPAHRDSHWLPGSKEWPLRPEAVIRHAALDRVIDARREQEER